MKYGNLSPGAKKAILAASPVILIAGAAYGANYSYGLHQDLRGTEAELAERSAALEENSKQLQELAQRLAETEKENENITAVLSEEQKKNLDLEREKRRNEREIDTLTKLTTLDPELLKKYSKVYFLSENYEPARLKDIDDEYLIDPARPLQTLDEVAPYLEDLLEDAEREDIPLRVLSAYRSFEEQARLKSGYVVQYGSGANSFSAEQGYSEHQLGTTVDFTTPEIRGAYLSFENTPAFEWLTENAYKYGFILSYPKGNQFYIYEPWHWRFVGEDLAEDLHEDNKHFYEMDQREIDEYLIDIFD